MFFVFVLLQEDKNISINLYMGVNNGKESDNVEKTLKNKLIGPEEFNMKESRRYNVPVLINHHQYLENILSSVIIYTS